MTFKEYDPNRVESVQDRDDDIWQQIAENTASIEANMRREKVIGAFMLGVLIAVTAFSLWNVNRQPAEGPTKPEHTATCVYGCPGPVGPSVGR